MANLNKNTLVRKEGCCKQKIKMVESLLFIGAGAEAGEKNIRSRSKTDRLHNTGHNKAVIFGRLLVPSSLKGQIPFFWVV